jgi:hypothetical protein
MLLCYVILLYCYCYCYCYWGGLYKTGFIHLRVITGVRAWGLPNQLLAGGHYKCDDDDDDGYVGLTGSIAVLSPFRYLLTTAALLPCRV